MRGQTLAEIVSVGTLLFGFGEVAMSQTSQPGNVGNVVLVHGGWVDGSGWEGVYKALKKSGLEPEHDGRSRHSCRRNPGI